MIRIAFLLALFPAAVALAQASPDEIQQAEANLRARQAARAAAATQPAHVTRGELETMRAEIAALKRENLQLRTEIARLKQQPAIEPTTRPANGNRLRLGMTLQEARDLLGADGKVVKRTDKDTTYHWIVGQREILASFAADKLTAFTVDRYIAPPSLGPKTGTFTNESSVDIPGMIPP